MTPAIAGRSTPEATAEYCATRGNDLRPAGGMKLGRTRLRVSGVGFGSYRIHNSVPRHHRSLERALRSGVNLIDTSANYGDGGSEELIGSVVRELIGAGEIQREQIVVVTKGGYIQGRNMEVAQRRAQMGRPFPELVQVSGDCWHSMHPEFLEDQIARSLSRLQLESVDVYLIHNPEYFLEMAHQHGAPLDEARREYYRRIREAFLYLEQQAREGRIGCYGISSNSFPAPAGEYDFTSLEQCLDIAREIASDHHFSVIQLPANLYESGAWMNRTQENHSKSVLQFAQENQLGVLINRPLNAIVEGRLIRLADPPEDGAGAAQEEIESFARIESEIESNLKNSKIVEETPPLEAARTLRAWWNENPAPGSWNRFLSLEFVPTARESLSRFAAAYQAAGLSQIFDPMIQKYLDELNMVIESVGNYFSSAGRNMNWLHGMIHPILPEELKSAPLSRKAIWALRSQPGVSSVLVGMRRENYVEDALAAAAVEPGRLNADQWREIALKLSG